MVHAGREEVRLCHLWSGEVPGNLFDLQIAAGLAGLPYPLGHGNLVNQVLGVQISKGETLTEWRNRPLTREQIRYAFDDVRYLLPAWERLSAKLDELGRLAWAREEFARLKVQSTPEEPAEAGLVARRPQLLVGDVLVRGRPAVALAEDADEERLNAVDPLLAIGP